MKQVLVTLASVLVTTGAALSQTEEQFKQAVAEGARSRGLCTTVLEIRALGQSALYEVVCRKHGALSDIRYIYNGADGTFSGAATSR